MAIIATLVFRAAVLVAISAAIWQVMGDELIADALNLQAQGKKELGADTPFKDYPWWLKTFVVLMGLLAAAVVGMFLYLVVGRLRSD